ncbi:hypothetical protein OHB13_37485 (plasmid) [Streptomyces sp. NBC_00440]|uniref:hypothetical protein n=1 Tax=unclassified Streptomyces TaxID=2593676 RepID=UPI002E1F32EE|nr:hypothetical protein OG760_36840 [Streptomyces sp. NBC_00963]
MTKAIKWTCMAVGALLLPVCVAFPATASPSGAPQLRHSAPADEGDHSQRLRIPTSAPDVEADLILKLSKDNEMGSISYYGKIAE